MPEPGVRCNRDCRDPLARALLASALLHVLLISLPFSTLRPFFRYYPPPLAVTLPQQPAPVAPPPPVPPVPEPLQQTMDPLPLRDSSIVELTPIPESPPPAAELQSPLVFLPAAALTVRPKLLNPDWLDEVAWRLPVQVRGRAMLTIEIDAEGNVRNVLADGANSEFVEWLQQRVAEHARFSPGERDGVAVPSRVRVEVDLSSLGGR